MTGTATIDWRDHITEHGFFEVAVDGRALGEDLSTDVGPAQIKVAASRDPNEPGIELNFTVHNDATGEGSYHAVWFNAEMATAYAAEVREAAYVEHDAGDRSAQLKAYDAWDGTDNTSPDMLVEICTGGDIADGAVYLDMWQPDRRTAVLVTDETADVIAAAVDAAVAYLATDETA